MFNDLLTEKVQYVVWQLPSDVPLTQTKIENYRGNPIEFRNFLETTDYVVYFNKNLNETINKKIEEFYDVCMQLSKNSMTVSSLISLQKLSHSKVECWKTFSWKRVNRIKEILFQIKTVGKYVKPIILLSDAIGGATLERKPVNVPLFKQLSAPKPLEKEDPIIISCSVCLENKKNILFSPCNHVACCSLCAQKCETCPICRGDIDNVLEIFF